MSRARCRTRRMLAGLPECLALLVPVGGAAASRTIFAHAMWLKTWFQDRAAIALELLHRAGDDELRRRASCASPSCTGLPHRRRRRRADARALAQAPAGHAHRHAPAASRWPNAASRSQPNAEQHLRSRARLADALRARVAGRDAGASPARCTLLARRAALRVPAGDRAGRRDAGVASCASSPTPARATRFPQGMPAKVPAADRARARRSSPTLKYEAYFLTVADIVALGARAGHPLPGPRQRRQLGRSATASASPRSTRRAPTLLFERFISVERNEPPDIDIDFEHQRREEVIQYIYGKYGRAPRRAHRASSSATGRARRCATSAARSASTCSASTRSRQEPALVRRPRHRARAAARERLRSRIAGRAAVDRAHRAAARLSAPPARSTRAASSSRSGRMAAAGAGRERRDGRPHRHPVGQGRPRRARPAQGRHPRARHAERDPPLARAHRRASSARAVRDAGHPATTTRRPTT